MDDKDLIKGLQGNIERLKNLTVDLSLEVREWKARYQAALQEAAKWKLEAEKVLSEDDHAASKSID